MVHEDIELMCLRRPELIYKYKDLFTNKPNHNQRYFLIVLLRLGLIQGKKHIFKVIGEIVLNL